MNRIFKKTISAALALTLTAGNFLPVVTAFGAQATKPSFEFLDSGSDKKQDAIIEGDVSRFKINRVPGYVLSTDPFEIKAEKEDGTIDKSTISIIDESKIQTKTGLIQEGDGDKKQVVIKGKFNVIQAEAIHSVTKFSDTSGNRAETTKAVLDSKEALTQYSKITFECTTSEEGESVPGFKVKEATGIFKGADSSSNGVSVEKVKRNQEYKLTVFPTGTTTSGSKVTIAIFPSMSYKIKDPEDPGKTISTKDIQKGTEFEIIFDITKTEPIVLTVVKPQKSVNEMAELISQQATRNEFIVFAKENDEEFVTDNFTLKCSAVRYRKSHDIRWESEVVDSVGQELVGATEAQKQVVQLPKVEDQSGADIVVKIKPVEEDTYVKLKATVSLKMDSEVCKKEVSFVINVKGTGKLPSVSNIKDFYKVDYETGVPKIENVWGTNEDQVEAVFPKKIDMNNGLCSASDFHLKPGNPPHEMGMFIKMGQKNSSSVYVKIQSTNPKVLEARVYDQPNNSSGSEPYTYGSEIKNTAEAFFDEGKVVVGFTPREKGSTILKVQFFIKGRYGKDVILNREYEYPVQVIDTSPSRDSSLSNLKVVKKDKTVLDIGFNKDITEYEQRVPHAIDKVSFIATKNDKNAKKDIGVVVTSSVLVTENGVTKNTVIHNDPIESGKPLTDIEIPENGFIEAKFTVTAQSEDKTTYKVTIIREPPSDDATLKALEVRDTVRGNTFSLTPAFQREGYEYSLVVPYKVREISIDPIPNHEFVESITVDYDNEGTPVSKGELKPSYKLAQEKFGMTKDKANTFVFHVTPENGDSEFYGREYTLNVYRENPSEDSFSKDIKLIDYKTQKELSIMPKFDKELFSYELRVPYETDKVKFKLASSSAVADKIEVIDYGIKGTAGLTVLETIDYQTIEKKNGVIDTKAIDVKEIKEEGDFHRIAVKITAEDGKATSEYKFDVYREPPENDADLKSLKIKGDENINHEEIEYDFFADVLDYEITVPYDTKTITMIPTVASETASAIEIKASTRVLTIKAENGKETSPIKLEKPTDDLGNTLKTDITVKVIAQNKTTEKTYNYHISREAPCSDASLLKLEVSNTEPLKPQFKPSEHSYTAVAIKDSTEVTVTATPNDPNAIMWIGKDKLEAGVPSKPIDILEEQVEIVVNVTAQDGKSKEKYIVNVTNLSGSLQSDNADLESLTVNYGDMRPKFNPSITNYNVAVSSETDSVQFVPRASDKYSKVEVFRGSKAIGDESGRFFDSIDFGENKFSVKVTSPSTKNVKIYNVSVNREVEDKQASFKPVTPEQINWETEDNIIVVSVSEYPVLTSEVFIKMRDEYPEKTLVLEGNDYSLQFKGKDLSTNIPHRTLYDFKLYFETPEEERIEELLYDIGDNRNLDTVYMYFRYHGPLPGPCILNISIGNFYGGKKLYMNYFNDERNRIDYYGFVRTNQKGNFSVRLDHFSTYALTNRKIDGAEDRSGIAKGGYNSGGAAGAPIIVPSTNKVHPNTGKAR